MINKRHVSRFQSGFTTDRSTTENTERMINKDMYRGSSLGSQLTAVQLKTLERMINKRHVSQFQSGFRTDRSTTENT